MELHSAALLNELLKRRKDKGEGRKDDPLERPEWDEMLAVLRPILWLPRIWRRRMKPRSNAAALDGGDMLKGWRNGNRDRMKPHVRPTVTAFERSPDGGRGLARDMRVRWALEEVGQPYDVRPVSFAAMKKPAHRALHPFGQIPTYEEGDLSLFETGAIVFHIACRHEGLLPEASDAQARAVNWMFAALSTLEPPVVERDVVLLLERNEIWFERRLRTVEDRVDIRLNELSRRLGNTDWLDGAFSAGDLMTADVLRRLTGSGLMEAYPNLSAFVARAEARPAFRRAFDAQRDFFQRCGRGCQR